VSPPELSVVCKSCGSEVSPYVTECPYCGHRIRKRAPRLEREGDEIKVRESRREKRRREKLERRLGAGEEREEPSRARRRGPDLDGRPVATLTALAIPAILLVLQRAIPWNAYEAGAIAGPVGSEPWRYLTAPFVYEDMGMLIVCAIAIAIFGSAVERRIGSVATATLIVACGTGGALVAGAAEATGLNEILIVAGGNGIALGLVGAWLMIWRGEAKTQFSEPFDVIGVITVTVVLMLLPLVEITADPIAGLAGGLLGLVLGDLATRRRGVVDE
jgi:membrane associated rhomboid family serine protease/DNA-directed RNA polymerase subunit RPC12/RpoP